MCTYVTSTADVTGSGYGGDDWFRVDRAVVYFDHPQDAPLDHALCIDVWGGTRASGRRARRRVGPAARGDDPRHPRARRGQAPRLRTTTD